MFDDTIMTHYQPKLFDGNHDLALQQPLSPEMNAARPKRSFDLVSRYSITMPDAPAVSSAMTTTTPTTTTSTARGQKPLPKSYRVSNNDVVCGRGRGNCKRPGNLRFREIVKGYVGEYQDAKSKVEKASVLSAIVEEVKAPTSAGSPGGLFVKQIEDGSWWELGEVASREKAGHAIREAVGLQKKHGLKPSSRPTFKRAKTEEMEAVPPPSSPVQRHDSSCTTETDAPAVPPPPPLQQQPTVPSAAPSFPMTLLSSPFTMALAPLQLPLPQHTFLPAAQPQHFPQQHFSQPFANLDLEPKPISENPTLAFDDENDSLSGDDDGDFSDESFCIFGKTIASLPPPSPTSEPEDKDDLSYSCWST